MTAIAYFDCPAGASGDMILAAFIDAGLPLEHLKNALSGLDVSGYELETQAVLKQGLSATHFDVRVGHQHHHRHLGDIRRMIEAAGLPARVEGNAIRVFQRLAEVEGRMHGHDPEDVHFHEVGAVDSIVDIVGACVAWDWFDLEEAWVSPLPLGSGWVQSAHGRLPLPAPATLRLLDGVPTYGTDLEAELVTPTGAALLTTLADGFGVRPAMTITVTGHGAGTRDLADRPNILRLTVGRAERGSTGAAAGEEQLVVGETNIDDMNPELMPHLIERLLASGALDAWVAPIQMKKGRPAWTLSFLARPHQADELAGLVLAESTSLGIRLYPVRRLSLEREPVRVETPFGLVTAKKIMRGGAVEIAPEFEECRRLADETGHSLREIYAAVIKAGVEAVPDSD